MISIVTPAYNEEKNLHALYERLCAVMETLGEDWEWIIVDDRSQDATYEVAKILAAENPEVKVIRFSRNFGNHQAVLCGLLHTSGNAAVLMAADLQDPPEIIPELLKKWEKGNSVVWAIRGSRQGETKMTVFFSRAFYWTMRHLVGLKEIPATGADFFLIDRKVISAVSRFKEGNCNFYALLAWLGFNQDSVTYTKEARLHGESGWTLRKKIKLALDSIVSFSSLPIKFMSWLGLSVSFLGFLYAAILVVKAFVGETPQGWSSLMVVILFASGIIISMMGILGEYLWRTLDEAKGRPRHIVEDKINFNDSQPDETGKQ